jgi:uncharacterized protein YjbI with pentapeptide repeats
MRVAKPLLLGLTTRPIEHRKRFGLCVSAFLHFPFTQSGTEEPTLWTEMSLWPFLAKEMPQGPLIDEGVAKLTPEFLVHGYAFAPKAIDGQREPQCAVRARLADVEKTVIVSGERAWIGDKQSHPTPCDRIPLSWSSAYGGPDYAANPVGKGRLDEPSKSGGNLRRLPNLEYPHQRVLKPDTVISPAAFDRIDSVWPQRAVHRGTYDANWYKDHSPGFAPDMDWRYFNFAPQDQWMPKALVGNEHFVLENMHPEHARIEGYLPGFIARCFAQYRGDGDKSAGLREIPLRLTTVWFFPHAKRGVLVLQGLAEVEEDDGSDVVGLMGAIERLGEPRDDAHYAQAWEKRQDPQKGGLYSLRESDLLPTGLTSVDPDFEASKQSLAIKGHQAEAQYRRAGLIVDDAREQAREEGKDPDALGIRLPAREPEISLENLPEYVDKQNKEAEIALKKTLNQAAAQILEAEDEAERNGIDPASLLHRGPPRYSAAEHLDEMAKAYADSNGSLSEDASKQLKDVAPKLTMLEAAHRKNYLDGAHSQAPAMAMTDEKSQSLRVEIQKAHHKKISFAQFDLTGADLSNLDLRGADFTEAWLESANLSGANVSGAKFSYAVLAHANLTNVIGIEASFSGANLGRAKLKGAVLDKADLSNAMLMNTVVDGVQLRGAKLIGTQLVDSFWGEVDATEADASGQIFLKLDFRKTTWDKATLTGTTFSECQLQGTEFNFAHLHNATFVNCSAENSKFSGAQLISAVFVEKTILTNVDLRGANCEKINLGGISMQGAQCEGANFTGGNLRLVDLRLANLRLVVAKGCLLIRARLDDANAQGANFQDAILQNANLKNVDLTGSNLFGADLSRVRLDGSTRFDNGLLKRARTYPRLTPEQHARLGSAPRASP